MYKVNVLYFTVFLQMKYISDIYFQITLCFFGWQLVVHILFDDFVSLQILTVYFTWMLQSFIDLM